jgi:hypothetical protein
LGDQALLISNDLFFSLLFGHFGEFSFLLLIHLFVFGVDNALIKWDCEHVVDMCPWCSSVMSDCQVDDRLWLSLDTNHGISVWCNMFLGLWYAGVEHRGSG